MANLIIRPMQAGDIAQVMALEKGTPAAWSREHLEDELQQPAGFQFVACCKGSAEIVAVLCGRTMADEAEILKLSVADHARQRGYGYQLLDFALNYCGKKGAKNCFLELRASNKEARSLYEKRGFSTTGTRRGYYDNPAEDGVLMQLELKTQ